MHRTLRPFELFEPDSIEEAIRISRDYGERGKILAGGLDLISKMRRWQMNPEALVSIQAIPGMDYVEGNGAGDVRIGALATLRSIEQAPAIQKQHQRIACSQARTWATSLLPCNS